MAQRHADLNSVLTVYFCAIVTICMDESHAAQPLWKAVGFPVRARSRTDSSRPSPLPTWYSHLYGGPCDALFRTGNYK